MEIDTGSVVSVINTYAWPLVVLLTICKFGEVIKKLIGKIGDIEIKIKNLLTLLLKQVETDPSLERALEGTKKEKIEKMLNKLFEDASRKIDRKIS
ncbi:MAG: hypothetical protein M0Z67_11020 [Nitrospiraceae bacterium]|nr:hypothetical protein [Nitrospiraceae bacterium]